jgi:peroxiredoxin family protein
MVLLDSDPYPTFKGLEIFQRKKKQREKREKPEKEMKIILSQNKVKVTEKEEIVELQ